MRCELKRTHYTSSGIFGELAVCDAGIFYTVERSFPNLNNSWGYCSKVQAGEYVCKRYRGDKFKYETFMITDVPKFRDERVGDIFFRVANFQSDVDGDIGLGLALRVDYPCMVEASRAAHKEFMEMQKMAHEIILTIS